MYIYVSVYMYIMICNQFKQSELLWRLTERKIFICIHFRTK